MKKFVNFLESHDFKTGVKDIKNKYPELERLNVIVDMDNMIAEVLLIRVAKDARANGIGSSVMQDLIDLADEHDMLLTLTPDSSFGVSKSALIKFYKKFGFVNNNGYYEANGSLIRRPQF